MDSKIRTEIWYVIGAKIPPPWSRHSVLKAATDRYEYSEDYKVTLKGGTVIKMERIKY